MPAKKDSTTPRKIDVSRIESFVSLLRNILPHVVNLRTRLDWSIDMSENVALVAPAWLWIGAMALLFAFGGLCAWLLSWVLNLRHVLDRLNEYETNSAMKVEITREIRAVSQRVAEVEEKLRGPRKSTLPSPAPILWQQEKP